MNKKILILLTAAAVVAALFAGNAQATVSCGSALHVVTIAISADAESAHIGRSGDAIEVDGAPCGAATVGNTDVIVVNGADGAQSATIDVSQGPFAPGYTAEASGISEIELELALGDGYDTVYVTGSPDDDTVVFGTTGIKLNGDIDADITPGGIDNVEAWSYAGSDTLSAAGDVSTGAPWPAGVTFHSGYGNDTVTGGDGDDALYGQEDNDEVDGGLGDDELHGEDGNDSLAGGSGVDTLRGGAGNDAMDAGDGNDLFVADATVDGDDRLVGGSGDDRASYYSRTSGVTISLDGAANDGSPGLELDNVVSDVENVDGGSGNDTLVGSAAANSLGGGALGSDKLYGGGGPDTVSGGEGADTLNAGGGDDFLYGGPGADTLNGGGAADLLYGGPENDTVNMGEGNDDFFAEANDGADSVAGGAGADSVSYWGRTANLSVTLDGVANDGESGESDNLVVDVEGVGGGAGNDTLVGSAAENKLYGSVGNDTIDGGAGADKLYGEVGDDTLKGGDDYDLLFGAVGADRFRLADGGADQADGGNDSVVDTVLNKDAVDTLVNFP